MPEELPPPESPEALPEAAPPPKPAPPPEDWEKRFTYLYADFENFRRRTGRERETLRAQTQAELLKGVLPIVEAAERAVEAVHSRPPKDPVRKGVELLERSIAAFLKDQGVEVVGVAGEAFRPEEHEAVAEAAPSPAAPDGHVAEVVQRGYLFPGGLLRPAKVVVARRPAKTPAPAEETDEVSDPAEPSR
ncbi:MAG: nucleotide exchange factor GrpE [Thermoplasmata archaeon]|nr:nucleotide exchange factor GrpE [Thermoplasmata archaeon]MCI4361612.1 nucleotide exchange factor GrpE [Thermoplasmata archaeon]